jgi:hypothetical protein
MASAATDRPDSLTSVETLNDPMLLTTDADFRIYRRHGRQIIPCILPRW